MVDNLLAKVLTEGWYHRGSKIAWMTLFVAYLELYISSFFFLRFFHSFYLSFLDASDASSHLYKRVCPSVRRSVRPSVRYACAKTAFLGCFWPR